MSYPVCDHCLGWFPDQPEQTPDPDLAAIDAYRFTCDDCSDRRRGCCPGPYRCDLPTVDHYVGSRQWGVLA